MSQKQSSSGQTSEGNGAYTDPPTVSGGTEKKYDPEDYSQKAINRGQREINGELVGVTKMLAEAIDKLIEKLSPGDKDKFKEVKELVSAAQVKAQHVADIRPPGCEPS